MTTATETTNTPPPEVPVDTGPRKSILTKILDVLGSYGMTIVILLFLMVLTYFGTIEQTDLPLHDVRTKYFDSFILFSSKLPFLPLPGAALLITLLAVNLFVGGILRLKRTPSRVGILIIHIGIAWLLLSGLVEFVFGVKGYVRLYEGESKASFQSHYDWQVTIAHPTENGRERAFVISPDELPSPGSTKTFTAEGLPFQVEMRGYLRNCRVRRASAGSGIDGYTFKHLADAKEPEMNLPGLTVRLVEPGGVQREAMLWGGGQPFVTRFAGKRWSVALERQTWELPFELTLRKFHHELHPRTKIASRYASDVTRTEDNVDQDVHISMNEPMRHLGYTFYQSGYGPQGVPPGQPGVRYYSVFSVGKNPADRGPLYACIVIGHGLAYHFIRKLVLHVGSQRRRLA